MDKHVVSPMKRLFGFLKPYNRDLYFASSSSIVNKIFDLMPPLLVGWVIDSVRGEAPIWISDVVGSEDNWVLAIFLSVLAVLIFGFESLFEWMYQRGFMNLAQRVQHDLRLTTYRRMQSREMRFFEDMRTGDAITILNEDVNQLERFLNTGFNDILQLLVLFFFSGIVLFATSWQLAIVGLLPIPLILLGSRYFQRLIGPRYKHMRDKAGTLSNRLENNISGIAVIQSFTAEDFEYQRVEQDSAAYMKANHKAIRLNALYIPLIRMLIALGFGGTLLLGSYWVLNDSGYLTVGELVLFSMMIQRVLWPVTSLGRTLDNYERAKASARRVFKLMDEEATVQDPAHPVPLGRAAGAISFRNVRFRYSDEVPLFDALNLEVAPGETVGIVGTTGSGKSSLVKLLMRFYEVQGGKVCLDGKGIGEYRLRDLRRNVALVSQDVYLFHGTVRENIAYGLEGVSDEEVVRAAKIAALHDFIDALPEGYDSLVGERGIKLSGGQRQRLSIARAILKDAPVMILDEATSAVDNETERAIQQNMDQFVKGRTALIVAHRLSTIRNADRILVLDRGEVAEQGKHADLLAMNGIYADLWAVQSGAVH